MTTSTKPVFTQQNGVLFARCVLSMTPAHVEALKDLLRWFDPGNDLRTKNGPQNVLLGEIWDALR